MESIDVFAPLASLQWVDRNTIHANDYNPNKVSEENLKLLIQSILTNGWTLPIVVRPDGTIIDGFHRWTVSGREPLLSLLGGSIGALLGMRTFRHKTKHWYFRIGLPLILLAQIALAVWLRTK